MTGNILCILICSWLFFCLTLYLEIIPYYYIHNCFVLSVALSYSKGMLESLFCYWKVLLLPYSPSLSFFLPLYSGLHFIMLIFFMLRKQPWLAFHIHICCTPSLRLSSLSAGLLGQSIPISVFIKKSGSFLSGKPRKSYNTFH